MMLAVLPVGVGELRIISEYLTNKINKFAATAISPNMVVHCQGSTQWICNAKQRRTNNAKRAQHMLPSLTRCWPTVLPKKQQIQCLQADALTQQISRSCWVGPTNCRSDSVISQNGQVAPVRPRRYPNEPRDDGMGESLGHWLLFQISFKHIV